MRIGVIAMAMLTAAPGAAEVTVVAKDRAERNAAAIREAYPRASLAAGEEGQVGFSIALRDDGRARSCRVTRSSGYARLDRATCDLLVSARFVPVRADGQRIASRHDGAMAWVLPAGHRRPVSPPAKARNEDELAASEVTCRPAPRAGSLIRAQTYCLTRADWARLNQRSRSFTEALQSDGGLAPVF